MKIFTLKNCDTCKKALKWLAEQGVAFENHDVRADGLTVTEVNPIVSTLGWEKALNRRSATWRGLNDEDKENLDNSKAVELILSNPTLMKRPVFAIGDHYIVGFDPKSQESVKAAL